MKLSQLASGIAIALLGCVEPYQPELKNEDFNILVVDGYINTTDDQATVKLSRAVPVNADIPPSQEVNATVFIEDEGGDSYNLNSIGMGIYFADHLGLDASKKYRLHLQTSADAEYVSDYVEMTNSPPIDSVVWKYDNGGVAIAVNSHDPQNQSRYYEWTFDETWEYTSSFFSTYKMVDGDAFPRPYDEQIYRCWSFDKSTTILVGNTERLSEDVIRDFPITLVPGESKKLAIKYSIEVQQRVLSKAEFDFQEQLEKTTESLGGMFDPMPSQVIGNLKNTNPNSSSPVLGYFSGGAVAKKRLFIEFNDLPNEIRSIYRPRVCTDEDVDFIPVESLRVIPNSVLLIDPIYVQGRGIIGYTTAPTRCIDCQWFGGTTKMPAYWQ